MKIAKLLDWLYPPACIACRSLIALSNTGPRDMLLCHKCQTLFEPIASPKPICNNCGIPTERDVERCVSCFGKTFYFTSNRAIFVYDDLMRDLLHELKFRRRKQVAKSLGKLWACAWAIHTPVADDAILVPLPLHPKKQKERGFNQAQVLAQQLSERLNMPLENILTRILDTPPQSGLHPRMRIENVAGAFDIAKDASVQGKNYIIIDDIYTTGASLNECARVLKNAGADNVNCMTLSIVEKKDNSKKATPSLPEGSGNGLCPL